MNNLFKIGSKLIGHGHPTFLIAEIAQAHDGSLGLAHSFIDIAADCGADAVKFQTHFACEESSFEDMFRVNFTTQDNSRFEYWKRIEFTELQWIELSAHARERGLIFLSSAFSDRAFNLLDAIGVPAWKIASGEMSSQHLLNRYIDSNKPLLVSTGLSTFSEIENLIKLLKSHSKYFTVMQCTSLYPTPLDKVGLNVLYEMKNLFNCSVGLSDHSGTIFPALAALNMDCDVIELHLTFSKKFHGPDTSSSITPDDFFKISEARNAFYKMRSNPVNKDLVAVDLQRTKILFGRSLALTTNLKAGTIITSDMLTLKKPGTGIPASKAHEICGKILKNDVSIHQLLAWSDFFES